MKIWKLISVLLLACMVGACDDDPAGEELNGGASVNTVKQAKASFSYESKTVLKNAGVVLVPIRLETPVSQPVKITFSAQQSVGSNIAREGIDFNILEKVVTVAAGDTIGILNVALLDNAKAEEDRVVVLNMTGVYNGEVSGVKTCSLHIVNNAFVEFQYKNRETYEAAGTYKIPLLVTGEIKETTTFTVRVKEGGTALEGTHFTLPETSFTLEKGATSADVEIQLIDDTQANEDRWFDLEIVSVSGSNATVGKSISICRVTIISEEVFKSVAFGATSFTVEEGKTLRIPVALDKAPKSGEPNVLVTFSVKIANSTAVEGEDFTIVEKQLTFVPGQKEEELVIEAINNNLINADKVIELSIKAADGANIGTPEVCQVTILNNDFPAFEQVAYQVEEDFGDRSFVVNLPVAQPTDVNLKIAVVSESSAVDGKHYTLSSPEVVIPAGETSAEVHVNIGYDIIWTEAPVFTVYVQEVNGISFKKEVCSTKVALTQSNYRKLLGTWKVSFEGAIGGDAATGPFNLEFSMENPNDFNKIVTCKGSWTKSDTWKFASHISYDAKTGHVAAIMREAVMTQRPFGDAKDIMFYSYSNASLDKWQGVIKGDYTELSWAGYWSAGIYDKGTTNKTGDWMHFNNIKMNKQ